jgi:hypothetical protein
MNPKEEAYYDIIKKLYDIYINKNKDYGNAFDKTLYKYGPVSFMTRMSDKWERLDSLFEKHIVYGKIPNVEKESFEDTVMDMANYCIMYLMWKKEINNDNTD